MDDDDGMGKYLNKLQFAMRNLMFGTYFHRVG